MTDTITRKIQGGQALFYGDAKDKPCGVQITGFDDLGRRHIINFEIFDCKDLGIRKFSMSGIEANIYTMANLDPKEVLEVLKEGFKRCGCDT